MAHDRRRKLLASQRDRTFSLWRSKATYGGEIRTVFRGGRRPAVVVILEIPGLHFSGAFGLIHFAAGS